ncbi:MAG: 50S ribosomal protein L11 methyltransferase [Phototrophicaceae bacterium]
MPQWVEVSLQVDGEAAEAIAQELQKWCHQGVSIEQAGVEAGNYDDGDVPPAELLIVRGYFPNDATGEETRYQIERSLGYMNMMLPMPQPTWKVIADEDWADTWKKHYKPVRLGKHIVVRPLWIDVELQDDDIEIALDPGMAFGTGTHPTTQLCLEALERLSPDSDVLDLGCGSGILSIAAAKLGATQIVGADVEAEAIKATHENASQNGVADKIEAYQGGLDAVLATGRQFDLVVVNILAKIIISMCDQNLGDTVRAGGQAIFSGIIEDQLDRVKVALRKTGLEPIAQYQQGDWYLIEAKRPIS